MCGALRHKLCKRQQKEQRSVLIEKLRMQLAAAGQAASMDSSGGRFAITSRVPLNCFGKTLRPLPRTTHTQLLRGNSQKGGPADIGGRWGDARCLATRAGAA